MTDTNWAARAVCTTDPEAMFPGRSTEKTTHARNICAQCPVRLECLQDALDTERGTGITARDGIRAGLTPAQRHKAYRKGETAAEALERNDKLAKRPPPPETLEDAFRRRTRPAPDGHLLWAGGGSKNFYFRGRHYGPAQASFLLTYGRAPVGKVTRGCEVEGCYAGACMTDRPMRQRAMA